jgi:hypothetical protein
MRIVKRSKDLRAELQNRLEMRLKSLGDRSEAGEANVSTTHEKRLQQAAQRSPPRSPLPNASSPVSGKRMRSEL